MRQRKLYRSSHKHKYPALPQARKAKCQQQTLWPLKISPNSIKIGEKCIKTSIWGWELPRTPAFYYQMQQIALQLHIFSKSLRALILSQSLSFNRHWHIIKITDSVAKVRFTVFVVPKISSLTINIASQVSYSVLSRKISSFLSCPCHIPYIIYFPRLKNPYRPKTLPG